MCFYRACIAEASSRVNRLKLSRCLSGLRSRVTWARCLMAGKRQHETWLCLHAINLWQQARLQSLGLREKSDKAARFSLLLARNRAFKGWILYVAMRRQKDACYRQADREYWQIKRRTTLHRWRRNLLKRRLSREQMMRALNLIYRTVYYRCFMGLKLYWEYKRKKYRDIENGDQHHVSWTVNSQSYLNHFLLNYSPLIVNSCSGLSGKACMPCKLTPVIGS